MDIIAGEAFDLLRFAGGFMRDAGFELLFPSWWTGRGSAKRPGVRAHVHAEQSNGGTFSLNALLDFDVEATLDGESLSLFHPCSAYLPFPPEFLIVKANIRICESFI